MLLFLFLYLNSFLAKESSAFFKASFVVTEPTFSRIRAQDIGCTSNDDIAEVWKGKGGKYLLGRNDIFLSFLCCILKAFILISIA